MIFKVFSIFILTLLYAKKISADFCTDKTPCGNYSCFRLNEWSSFLCDCTNGKFSLNKTCIEPEIGCVSNPCLNGGSCLVQENSKFICNCPSGFSGNLCEIKLMTLDICDISNPCLSGGKCISKPNSFLCECPSAYTGERCEFLIEKSCSSSPCINGGRCLDLFNQTSTKGYVCLCTTDFTGLNCETRNVKKCELSICNNGLCFDKSDGFFCRCLSGWYGELCDQKIPKLFCDKDLPCLNGGSCVNNGTSCVCPRFFSGPRCEIINAPVCAMNICSNGGTCYQLLTKLFCVCSGKYYGQYCELL